MDSTTIEALQRATGGLSHFAVGVEPRAGSDGMLAIRFTGHLDGEAASVVMDPLLAVVAAWDGAPKITIGMARLEYISSLGIGMLAMISMAARKRGIGVALYDPKPVVQNVLETLGILQILPVHVTHRSTP